MLSPKTVEVHRSHIMKKMCVESTAQLLHLLAKHSAELFENDGAKHQRNGAVIDSPWRLYH